MGPRHWLHSKNKKPNTDLNNDEEYVPSVRQQINNWFNKKYDPVMGKLWKKYVPKEGPCTILQGEISRCIGRLEGEYFRNGMMNMGGGSGFYEDMVDKITRAVSKDGKLTPLVQSVLEADAMTVKGADYEKVFNSLTSIFKITDIEASLNRIKMVAAAWCIANPEPIEMTSYFRD